MKGFLKNKYFATNFTKLHKIAGILKALPRVVSHPGKSQFSIYLFQIAQQLNIIIVFRGMFPIGVLTAHHFVLLRTAYWKSLPQAQKESG